MKTTTKSILGGRVEVIGHAEYVDAVAAHIETTATPAVHAVQPLPAELPDDDSPPALQWYESKTGNHQGLVIEEQTGRNIAVTYEKAEAALIVRACNQHAALLASHARLVAACEAAIVHMLIAAGLNPERTYCYNWIVEPLDPCACQICNIRAALAAAKGQP